MHMKTLTHYRGPENERELAVVARPDAPGRLMLLDAPRHITRTDDVRIVDDELTTIAEARLVAAGWAAERAAGREIHVVEAAEPARVGAARPERELARYATPAGPRVVVGQRIAGTVCVSDRPADERRGGAVLLVQRAVTTNAELEALVVDYVAESERRGEPACRPTEALLDGLAGALAA